MQLVQMLCAMWRTPCAASKSWSFLTVCLSVELRPMNICNVSDTFCGREKPPHVIVKRSEPRSRCACGGVLSCIKMRMRHNPLLTSNKPYVILPMPYTSNQCCYSITITTATAAFIIAALIVPKCTRALPRQLVQGRSPRIIRLLMHCRSCSFRILKLLPYRAERRIARYGTSSRGLRRDGLRGVGCLR
jgi:hypothetical protein